MLIIPRVIAEKELSKYLAEGWTFKTQLQSGDVLMEKEIDVETITGNILEQAQKQITEEKSKTDVEKITEQVMEQANKQIAEAIEKEKQKLLS
jgi:exoribonuclease R